MLLNELISSKSCSRFLRICVCMCHLCIEITVLLSFNLDYFFFYFCLITMVEAFSTMLNTNDKSIIKIQMIFCLFPDCRGEVIHLTHRKYNVTCRFLVDFLFRLRKLHSIPSFLSTFIMNMLYILPIYFYIYIQMTMLFWPILHLHGIIY